MKRLFIIISSALFLLCVGAACRPANGDIVYLLPYAPELSGVIQTNREDGKFYVMEEPVISEWEHGSIEIYGCYYDGVWGVNLYAYVYTNDPEELEARANDEEHTLYCTVKANGKELKRSSFGYIKGKTDAETALTRYQLSIGYYCSERSINKPLEVAFSDVIIQVPLVEKQGYPVTSEEGAALWKVYREK